MECQNQQILSGNWGIRSVVSCRRFRDLRRGLNLFEWNISWPKVGQEEFLTEEAVTVTLIVTKTW